MQTSALPHRPPFIKICGQTHPATVDCATAYGARFVGFIFHQGSPRSISPERAALIPTSNIARVGVFVQQGADEILPIISQARLDYVQLHGKQSTHVAEAIGPHRIIRVLWPEQTINIQELQQQIDHWAPYCAYFLLDTGTDTASGGLGRQLDLTSLNQLNFHRPWILAGGLNENNITQVLSVCHPDGLDFNSGLETAPGMKAPDKMLAALTTVFRSYHS